MSFDFTEIHPYVRYAQRLAVTPETNFKGQRAYDNRLFYLEDGHGTVWLDGTEYNLEKGDIMLWRSGLLYDLDGEKGEFTLLGLNFDFLWDKNGLSMPIPPGKADFEPSGVLEHIDFCGTDVLDNPIFLRGFYEAEGVLTEILEEYRRSRLLSAEINSSLARGLILRLIRRRTAGESENKKRPDEILRYIDENCAEIGSNESLGAAFGYHPNYLSHLVASQTGMSLHKYILKCRVMRAIDLLQTTSLSASEIAVKTGFDDYNHFLKYFKKITGRNTGDFR